MSTKIVSVKKLVKPEVKNAKMVPVNKMLRPRAKRNRVRYSKASWAVILFMQEVEELTDAAVAFEVSVKKATVKKWRRKLGYEKEGHRERLDWPLSQRFVQKKVVESYRALSDQSDDQDLVLTSFRNIRKKYLNWRMCVIAFCDAFKISGSLLNWWLIKYKGHKFNPQTDAMVVENSAGPKCKGLDEIVQIDPATPDSYSKDELKIMGVDLGSDTESTGCYLGAGRLYSDFRPVEKGKPVTDVRLRWSHRSVTRLYYVNPVTAYEAIGGSKGLNLGALRHVNAGVQGALIHKFKLLEALFTGVENFPPECQKWLKKEIEAERITFKSFSLRVLIKLQNYLEHVDLELLLLLVQLENLLSENEKNIFCQKLPELQFRVARIFLKCSSLTILQLAELCRFFIKYKLTQIPDEIYSWLEMRLDLSNNDVGSFHEKFMKVVTVTDGQFYEIEKAELRSLKIGITMDDYEEPAPARQRRF